MPCWNSKREEEMGRVKERGRGRGERKENGLFFLPFPSPFSFFRSFALAATQGLLFLLSPIFLCHTWIKDGFSALAQPENPLVPKPDTRKMNEFWKETIFFSWSFVPVSCSLFLSSCERGILFSQLVYILRNRKYKSDRILNFSLTRSTFCARY